MIGQNAAVVEQKSNSAMMLQAASDDAVRLQRQGRLKEAQALCYQVLQRQPDRADALHLLGVIRHQQGDNHAAVQLISRAISLSPQSATFFNNHALALHALGRFEEAREALRRALEIRPRYAQAMANLGMVQESLREHDAALATYREALKIEPYHPDATIKLARLLEKLDRSEEAIQLYEQGIAHVPCLDFYVNLGALWISADRPDMAVTWLRKAVERAPDCVPAHVNLGMAHAAAGHDAEALASYHKALALQPGNEEALNRLAAFLGQLGRSNEAETLFRQLLAIGPYADNWMRFGDFLMNAAQTREAAEAYQQAIEMDERHGRSHFNLGQALEGLHDLAGARGHFARAAELRPDKPWWRLRAEVCGPAVFESAEEIEEYWQPVERTVECWRGGSEEGEKGSKTPSPPAPLPKGEGDLVEAGVFPGFGLSYLGRNTRGIKEQFAALYGPFFRDVGRVANLRAGKGDSPHLPARPFGCFAQMGTVPFSRVRIGFLVTRRHEGIFVRCMAGVLRHLDRKRFELVVLAPRASIELLKQRLANEQLRYVPFGENFGAAVRTIRAAACDLIYYWEVGSDAMNYFLPFARCAPVQCTSHGSLTTTGVPAIDWFFSSELMERPSPPAPLPEGEGSNMPSPPAPLPVVEGRNSPSPPAPLPKGEREYESHYSERLWKSRTLLMCQERLAAVVPGARGKWGLPEDRHLYGCLQNPLKLHPDFDRLLAGILAADPLATIVLLADESGHAADALRRRFARWLPSPPAPLPGHHVPMVGEGRNAPSPPAPLPKGEGRIIFVPRQKFADYCGLLQACDVLLDPLHYGAGSSCYDAFSFNLPMVTLPTEFMPGRVALGFYRKMQFEELVVSSAEEYVSKAVQVASDRDYCEHVTKCIAQRSGLLFNDLEAVREHERFFEDALARVC